MFQVEHVNFKPECGAYTNSKLLVAIQEMLKEETGSTENSKEDPDVVILRYFTYLFPNLLLRTWEMIRGLEYSKEPSLKQFYEC